MRKVSIYKCPHCNMKFKTLTGWCSHVEKVHQDEIPEGFTTAQYCYHVVSKLPIDKQPRCVICKEVVEWNENTLKYNRFCNKKSCKVKAAAEAKKNMVKKYGKEHLLNDPDVQKKMLLGRRISGSYKFSDGTEFGYVGSYEKDFLMMMDSILNWDSQDLMSPSPNVYKYIYEGKEHFYIPDFFIPSLNLEIEIKEAANGHGRENGHWKIQQVDKVKEKLKDEVLENNKNVNYIKVVNKEYEDFVEKLDELRSVSNAEVQSLSDMLKSATESYIIADESVMTSYSPIVGYQGTLSNFKLQTDPQDYIEYKDGKPFRKIKPKEDIDDDDEEDDEITTESALKDDPDIYYNKEEFETGKINVCMILGLSGSGKTTLSKDYIDKKNYEVIELDDVSRCMYGFSDENLKEYGSLIYNYWVTGPGKERREDFDRYMEGYIRDFNIENKGLIKDFLKYAFKYASSHKNIKFIFEGVWPLYYYNPEEFKDYAVFMKGTSAIKSIKRATVRQFNDGKDKWTVKERLDHALQQFISSVQIAKELDKNIKIYRKYFTDAMNNNIEPVKESKLNAEDRNELKDSEFGIPELRKYPLNDRQHTVQAIRMFNYCPEEYREELAKRIKAAMRKFDISMEFGVNNKIKDYIK